MTTTPKYGIPLIAGQQNQPEIPHNQMVLLLQSILGGVIDQQNAPPGSPDDGDAYLVGAAGTGAFAGKNNKIAMFFGGWFFLPGFDSDGVDIPIGADHEGLELYVQADDARLRWSGAAWAALASGGDPTITPFLAQPANPGWDPLFTRGVTLSNSNKRGAPNSGGPYNHMFGVPARYTGKKYWEIVPGSTSFSAIGLCGPAGHFKQGDGSSLGAYQGQVAWYPNGDVVVQKQLSSYMTLQTIQTWTTADRCCFALDLDADLLWMRTNGGNWNNNGANNPATGVGGIDLTWAYIAAGNKLIWPGASAGNTSNYDLFLLAADQTQGAPSGFSAWGAP